MIWVIVEFPLMEVGKNEIHPIMMLLLDTEKCLVVEIVSDKCKACQTWQKRVNDVKYPEWKTSHQCKINHTGSANSMEAAGGRSNDPWYRRDLNTRTCSITVTLLHTIIF